MPFTATVLTAVGSNYSTTTHSSHSKPKWHRFSGPGFETTVLGYDRTLGNGTTDATPYPAERQMLSCPSESRLLAHLSVPTPPVSWLQGGDGQAMDHVDAAHVPLVTVRFFVSRSAKITRLSRLLGELVMRTRMLMLICSDPSYRNTQSSIVG